MSGFSLPQPVVTDDTEPKVKELFSFIVTKANKDEVDGIALHLNRLEERVAAVEAMLKARGIR